MLHELWSSVFREFVDQQASFPPLGIKRPTFIALITEQLPNNHRQPDNRIQLTSLISLEESKLDRERCLPSKGWLVILDLIFSKSDVVTGNRKCQLKRKFGFVEDFRCYRRTKEQNNLYINQLEGTRMQNGACR